MGHPPAVRPAARPPLAPRTRAPSRAGHARGHADLDRQADGVLGRPLHRGVRGGVVFGDRARTGRCLPVRQLPDIDRRSRGGRVWRGPWGRIRPPPAEPPPPEEPPSARARPLVTRRTGRAALPSAIFPHTLPEFGQSSWPFGSVQHSGGTDTGKARHIQRHRSAVGGQSCNVTGVRGQLYCWRQRARPLMRAARHAQQSNRWVQTRPAPQDGRMLPHGGPDRI